MQPDQSPPKIHLGASASCRLVLSSCNILFICILCSSFAFAPAQASKKPKKTYSQPILPLEDKTYKPLVLTGSVKHSESLPPVDSKLTIGVKYDEKKLEKPPASRDWYKLPSWLAGTWESDMQTNIMFKDGKQTRVNMVKNHGIADYGKRYDRNGGVWDYLYSPAEVENDSELTMNKDLTTKQTILNNSDTQLVLKEVFTRRRIDKATKKIIDLTQNEQISCLRQIGPDKIELFGSLKEFDQQGHTIGLTHAIIVYKRKFEFHPVNKDKATKEDLEPSFEYYLKSHGKENLIPKQR